MSIIVFLLLLAVCMTLIFLVHKYFGKEEFYLLAIIYAVLSFLMSFKMIKIFGIDINGSIIFGCGLIAILYYFINKYAKKETKKLIIMIIISTIGTAIMLLFTSIVIPSVDDITSVYYQDLVFSNISTAVIYPISLIVTLFMSSYSFGELKLENKYQMAKTILTVIGIMFIDVFIFVYFNYAILVRFDTSLLISLNNYLVKTFVMIIFTVFISKLVGVKKVKK